MKIFGFYFVALINDWEELVDKQLLKIFQSELFSVTDRLYIHIFDPNNNLNNFIKKITLNDKIIITNTSKNEYEFGILRLIKNISETKNFYCYYFHTKGVSISEQTKNYYRVNDLTNLKSNVESWREYMEYFLIDLYKKNIDFLSKDNDSVGVQLVQTPKSTHQHYSGNFWWTKSSYIKKLPNINSLRLNHRWDAEFWIGYGNGNMKNLYSTSQAGYRQKISIDYKNEFLKK